MDQYCALSGGGGRGSGTVPPPPQAAPPLPGPQIAWPRPRPYRTLSDKLDLREALLLSSQLSLQSKQTLPAWHKRHLVRAAGDGPNLRWCELLIVLVPLIPYPGLWAPGSRPRPRLALHSLSGQAQSQLGERFVVLGRHGPSRRQSCTLGAPPSPGKLSPEPMHQLDDPTQP